MLFRNISNVIILSLYLLFCPLNICANQLEKAFYAVSSLRYFLQEMQKQPPDQDQEQSLALECSPEDLEGLWERAGSIESFKKKIDQAKHFYEMTRGPEGHQNFLKAQALLLNVWFKLHLRILSQCEYPNSYKTLNKTYPNFEDNPAITDAMRLRMRPFLIPLNHDQKPILDKLFIGCRPTLTQESLINAGFKILRSQAVSFVQVVQHPKINGWLLKLFVDTEKRIKEGHEGWEWLANRCEGATNIRILIEKKKMKFFCVPDKYLYPLPGTPGVPDTIDYLQHPVVLLVTDMNLLSLEETVFAWQHVKREHIDELFCIISHGYGSTNLIHNVPLCHNGKFAFIDTEHPKRIPNYHYATQFLSPKMKDYWNKLVRKGGKA